MLNQVLVQFRTANGSDQNAAALTQKVIARVHDHGACWVGGTKWRGQAAVRISIANWTTTVDDIDRSATAILSALDESLLP